MFARLTPRRLASLALGIMSIGLIAVILSYFFFVPYDTISDKAAFWTALILWASPLAISIWAVRNQTPSRARGIMSDVIIVVGVIMLAVVVLQNKYTLLQWAAVSALPGFLTGILVGVDSFLIPRIVRGQVGPGH